jgi:hypothetical protein
MKRCPTCNQTFEEDWLSFCTQDGTTLVEEPTASSEPPPTVMAPSSSELVQTNDQATWNLPSANVASSQPQWESSKPIMPAWQPPPPPSYVQQQNKSLATASMVIGIISVTIGWLCLGPIPGIVAIILGGVSLSQIKKTPERVGGKQSAWVGIITGSITVLIYVGIMILYIVVLIVANA